ncbi:FecR domain-containing protein [Calycomorphotria hydatis]|uniref:FecR protein n=1 Tax=Calycomorphotria hydatis TaxID=2528027 RepID=A0A517TAJ5_9PLAN|nr:FecR domain-containing protein [Calycomorphotria hydatis]QDT65392.1 FecR protein [Calycomorphotria hydatis]
MVESSQQDFRHLKQLAEAVCSGNATADHFAELSGLLERDIHCCQWYLSYLDTHATLGHLEHEIDPKFVSRLITPKSNIKHTSRWLMGAVASMSAVLLICLCYFGYLTFNKPITVGWVVDVSADAKWEGMELFPGGPVFKSSHLQLTQGKVSLNLNNGTRVELTAPLSLLLNSDRDLYLFDGQVAARVSEKDKGFIVTTQDAEITDLGTEFLVRRDPSLGTEVAVSDGEVTAALFNPDGSIKEVLQLSAGQAARLDRGLQIAREFAIGSEFLQIFHEIDSRIGVKRMGGQLRSAGESVTELTPGKQQTADHILLVPEKTGIVLSTDEPLTLNSAHGHITLSPGTRFDSYLVHYDPGALNQVGPVGKISFQNRVLAVVTGSDDLAKLDSICAIPGTTFTPEKYRGLEHIGTDDEVTLSDDGMQVSFDLHLEAPNYFDQFRILVLRN